ncbi:MAG: hypothetical protein IJ639_12220 [Ruminococcus sp.]|nr:hypothetical protein [Ruminococcus sp.]
MKRSKVLLSIILVLSILVVSILPVLADSVTTLDEVEPVTANYKISNNLLVKIENANENEKIPVWIWFSDIDFDEANNQIKRLSGYSTDEFSSKKKPSYQPRLVEILDSVYNSDCDKDKLEQLRIENKQILNSIEPERKAKTNFIREYEGVRSKVLQEMYTAHNSEIISELGISSDRIIYQCDFTPSAIINLTVEEIVEVSADRNVTELFYYEDPEPVEPTDPQTNEMNAMHANLVTQANGLGYTGSGVNILVVGGSGYVGNQNVENLPYEYPETVYNVVNSHAYSIVNTANLPNNLSNHAQHVVNILKQYAPQANLYVVPWNDFTNLKWAVNECNIDLVCYAMAYQYDYQDYETYCKWFDVYTKNNSLPFVASAGNSESWSSAGWPAVSVPARGYNSIAAGSYMASTESMKKDIMENHRYAPTTGTSVACFKPDVVCAANDTSTAAPALAGILSWAMQVNSDLKKNPEVVKAITMASCHRKVKPYNENEPQEYMIDGLTQKQGAGAIDAFRLIKIALEQTYGEAQLTINDTEYQTDLLVDGDTNQTSTMSFDNDNLNVSIAWMVDGDTSSIPHSGTTTVNSIQDLFLAIYNDTDLVSYSYVENAGKQTAYLANGASNTIYTIRVNNVTDTDKLRNVKFGYAWSEKGNSELSYVDLVGDPEVGQTLNAIVTDSNGNTPDASNDFICHWQRSLDNGITWSSDLVDDSCYYNIIEDDYGTLIRCVVEPHDCSLYSPNLVSAQTQTIEVKYGDVNLDGEVNSNDPLLIQHYLASNCNLSDTQKIAADVDLDDNITLFDATIIWKYIYGIISTLPVV